MKKTLLFLSLTIVPIFNNTCALEAAKKLQQEIKYILQGDESHDPLQKMASTALLTKIDGPLSLFFLNHYQWEADPPELLNTLVGTIYSIHTSNEPILDKDKKLLRLKTAQANLRKLSKLLEEKIEHATTLNVEIELYHSNYKDKKMLE